jgi:hypothetical protein
MLKFAEIHLCFRIPVPRKRKISSTACGRVSNARLRKDQGCITEVHSWNWLKTEIKIINLKLKVINVLVCMNWTWRNAQVLCRCNRADGHESILERPLYLHLCKIIDSVSHDYFVLLFRLPKYWQRGNSVYVGISVSIA